jgi:hypothetical protein
LSDLPSLAHVEGASPIPASKNAHSYLIDNEAEVWRKDLEKDGSDDGHSNNQVPSDVKLLELPLEQLFAIGLTHKVMVSKDKHDCIVHVLENANCNCTVDVVISDVFRIPKLPSV